MHISKIKIKNFKSYKQQFKLDLHNGLNILVGNNETGKSTILEAIHLALTGMINGKFITGELSEYLFNFETIQEYLESVRSHRPILPPEICIEVFVEGEGLAEFEGDGIGGVNECGFTLKIALADKYQEDYNVYIAEGEITALPIEFYEVNWTTCARDPITPRRIPIKSALIDSSSVRYKNGSDVYISHIIKNHLMPKHKNDLVHAHRRLQAAFLTDGAVASVNEVIKEMAQKHENDKEIKLTIDLSSKDAWESGFMTAVENIPFHHIGKGEQAVIKTKLALEHKKSREASIILLEEPENHLSHAKLNELIFNIENKCNDKQLLISTHSSFVANKLGLEHLILLENKRTIRISELEDTTEKFFKKIPGYDTLRMMLCKKAILVEGDCDELLVQRAYMDKYKGRLPIHDQVDVISVGTSFLRFLQIAEKIGKEVRVVTDNDGKLADLKKKYENYLSPNKKLHINICFDEEVDTGPLAENSGNFNYNTLEPKFVKANSVLAINKILGGTRSEDELHLYMKANKTECALKIFETKETLVFPQYILDAIA